MSTNTYNLTNFTDKDVIKFHVDKFSNIGIELGDDVKKLPTMYWIPKLHKKPYKSRFIANSTSCTTKYISILLTSCLTLVKAHWRKYCNTTYENSGINLFWSIVNSAEFLSKLENKKFVVSNVSTYDFSTLYTSLPHDLIKTKLKTLIHDTFKRENKEFIACNSKLAFFCSKQNNYHKGYHTFGLNVICDILTFLLDNIFVKVGDKIYRQIIGIPMGTNCAPLIADLFLFCFERDFMNSLDRKSQRHIIEAFNLTSRYLDDICNIDNPYFHSMYKQIYPKELELNKANDSDVRAPFLDLNLTITNNRMITSIYDKRDDFNFQIVNYPNLSGNIPCSPSYGVYISQLIRFARCCSNVEDFHNRNLIITKKLLKQGYRYHKLRQCFCKFFFRYKEVLNKYNCNLNQFLKLGISQPKFYGDVLYKLRKIRNSIDFHNQFVRIINKFLKKGYDKRILHTTSRKIIDYNTLSVFSNLFN